MFLSTNATKSVWRYEIASFRTFFVITFRFLDEKDIGVRSKLEHPNVLEYIGQAEASPWM